MANPTLINTPFAQNGDKSIIQETAGSEPNSATWEFGFPVITSEPISSGGLPPKRVDFNGALNTITANIVHQSKGLMYEFDAAYAAKIGGYPLNARLVLTTGEIVRSTVAANTNDPNTNMTGWVLVNNMIEAQSVSDMSAIENPTDGMRVFVKSHYEGYELGSGTYQFEQLSTKTPNGGAWIAGQGGVWVLISENFIENFGVTPDNEDQSAKIQAAIDFYLDNGISEFSFERSNSYIISNSIKFKQRKISDGGDYADPKNKTLFNFNGARLVVNANNIKAIVISRDSVRINNLSINATGTTGVIGVYNGLDVENSDNTLRRSSMRMYLDNPSFDNLDVAMKFEPAEERLGNHWGSFYHTVMNPTAIHTNIMYEFRQSKGIGVSSNTRNTFIASKHVGGACTVFGEALESSKFIGVECELITKADSRLPNGEAVALYLPYGTPSDYQPNKHNVFLGFDVEVCTNYINIDAPETEFDGYLQGATNPNELAYIFNNTYGNVEQKYGGLRIVQHNSAARFGMLRQNDDGSTSSLFLENDGATNYKLSCDGRINIQNLLTNSVRSTTNSLEITSNVDSTEALIIRWHSEYGSYLANSSGSVKHVGNFIPIFSNSYSIGSASNRYTKLFTTEISATGLKIYSNNLDAIAGGLVVGDVYRTSTGQLMVVY